MLLEEACDDIQVDNYFVWEYKFAQFIMLGSINQALFPIKLILKLRMYKEILQDSAHVPSADQVPKGIWFICTCAKVCHCENLTFPGTLIVCCGSIQRVDVKQTEILWGKRPAVTQGRGEEVRRKRQVKL